MKLFQAKRLLLVRDRLLTVPKNLFDIKDYIQHRDCGTVGCVLGHAGYIPQLRKAGLQSPTDGVSVAVRYKGQSTTAHEVCPEFFGLNSQEISDIFYSYTNETPQDSINEIESVVRKYHPELL